MKGLHFSLKIVGEKPSEMEDKVYRVGCLTVS